jgi:fucose permease
MGMERRSAVWPKIVALDMLLLCYSFNVAVVGQMFDPIRDAYRLTIAEGSMLPSVQSVGGFAAVLLCITFMDALNKRKVLAVAGVIYFVLFLSVGAALPLAALFAVFVGLGLFGGMVDTMTNSVMVETAPRRPEKFINMMHMLFALGATASPFIAQQLNAAIGLAGTFYAFGGFALLWAAFLVFAFRQDMGRRLIVRRESFRARLRSVAAVYRLPGMVEVGIVSALMSIWQIAAMLYTSSMAAQASGREEDGALALTVLFSGVMLSRLIYTRFASRVSPGRMLAYSNLAGAVAWTAAMLVPGVGLKIALVGVTALLCGNNFPVDISAACRIAPGDTAAASGTVIFGSYIASFAFMPAIGALADAVGLGQALIGAAVPLLALFPFALSLHKKMRAAKAA